MKSKGQHEYSWGDLSMRRDSGWSAGIWRLTNEGDGGQRVILYGERGEVAVWFARGYVSRGTRSGGRVLRIWGKQRGFQPVHGQRVVGMTQAVGIPPPGGRFLPQHNFLGLRHHLRLPLHRPSFPLVVRRPVSSILGFGGGGGEGRGRGGGDGRRCALWGAGLRCWVPVQVRARVWGVPERVGLLHDAACLAVKRGAVAAVAHRLVVHALPSGEPPGLGGSLLGLGLQVGLGVWLWVVFRMCLCESGYQRSLWCTKMPPLSWVSISPGGRLWSLVPWRPLKPRWDHSSCRSVQHL